MQAQDLKGVLYLSLTERERDSFEEIRNTPPSDRHKEWLFKKLTAPGLTYSGNFPFKGIKIVCSYKNVLV